MAEKPAYVNVLPRKIATIPFSELQELYTKCGSNKFGDLISREKNLRKDAEFHRKNKNRPREVSSKIPPSNHLVKSTKMVHKPIAPIDPRFHQTYGNFDHKKFENNYKFLDNIKKKEQKLLKKKLKNPELEDGEREKIKKLLQRMSNQRREEIRKKQEIKLKTEKREYEIKELKQGRKPKYCKKTDEKLLNLVRTFETMKEKGGLQKHIKRRRKKSLQKDKRKLNLISNIL